MGIALVLIVSACASSNDAEVDDLKQRIAELEAAASSNTLATTQTTSDVSDAPSTTSDATTATTVTTATTSSRIEPLDPQASSFVGGTFVDELPPGTDSEISVILEGSDVEQSVPIIVRNMTQDSVIGIEVNGIARDQDGVLLASGSSQGLSPNLVAPGEIAFGWVYFGFDLDLSKAASIDWSIHAESSTGDFARFAGIVDLVPVEWSSAGDNVVVLLSNDTEGVVEGPIGVNAACFDSSGAFVDVHLAFADGDSVEPEAAVAAQVDLFGSHCDGYLVAGSGYDF